MRESVFQSGIPLLTASICFLALAYLTHVRRERFLAYWTVAWAMICARYIWNMVWGPVWPTLWTSQVSSLLRVAFALCLLAGAMELRKRRIDGRWVALVTFAFPAAMTALEALGVLDAGFVIIVVTSTLIAFAGLQLAGAQEFPRFERVVAATALITYGLFTGVLPQLPDDSRMLASALLVAWATQLIIGISMIAMYFRSSYQAEIAAQRQLGATLTEALRGFVSICMHCKAIRDEQDQWQRLESYVATRSATVFSHGLCESCAATIDEA